MIGSASKWTRLVPCPASGVLPGAPSEPGEAAIRGTAIHTFIETASIHGKAKALDQCPEKYRDFADSIPLAELPTDPHKYSFEIAAAFDIATGKSRKIGERVERDYGSVSESEVVGTADVIGVCEDSVYVGDYKTGRSWLPEAGKHWQLLIMALIFTELYERDQAYIEWIRISDDGTLRRSGVALDAFDLIEIRSVAEDVLSKTRAASRSIEAGEDPEVTEGKHCRYCPAMLACPAKTQVMRQLASPGAANAIKGRLTVANCTAALEAYERMRDIVTEVGKHVHSFARQHPIPLEDGSVFCEVERSRESIDGECAHRILEEQFGAEVAAAGVETKATTTKSKLKEGLRIEWTRLKANGEKITLRGMEEALLYDIREANGIISKTVKRFEKVRPE